MDITMVSTWIVSMFWVFLVRIFPNSDWIQKDTKDLSVFSPIRKIRTRKLQIRTFSRNGSFPEKFSSYWPPDLGTLVNSWFLCKNIFLRVIFKRSPRFPPIHSNPKVFWKRWTRTFCKFYRKIPGCNLIHKVNICYYLLY